MENRKAQPVWLDEKVILTMMIISLLALIITGFKYKNHQYCYAFTIKTKAAHFRTDEPISFETDAKNGTDFQWDFGDNEGTQTNINSAIHSYDQPGEYTIAVTINGNCSEYKTLYIAKAPKLENPLLIPTFACPQMAEVGKPVSFYDTTIGARSWEWRFGESAVVDATSSTASYTYKTPGLKTISLVINNNLQQTAICKVFVSEPMQAQPDKKPGAQRSPIMIVRAKPNTPSLDDQETAIKETPKPQGVSISKQELEEKLRKVAGNLARPEDFSPYLCGNLNLPVSLNGEEITFQQLCTKLGSIKNEKKIKELNVQQIKSNETNCIISLNVNLRMRKGFLGIF